MELTRLFNYNLNTKKVYKVTCLDCHHNYTVVLFTREWHIIRECSKCNSNHMAYKLERVIKEKVSHATES